MNEGKDIVIASCVREIARRVGFDACGVVSAEPVSVPRWGPFPASLGYLERNFEKRLDVTRLVPGARTVVVCALNGRGESLASGAAKVAAYARARDYHIEVRERLDCLLRELGVPGRAFVDTAPVLEKEWAIRAGLGWRGRNTLLISSLLGPWAVLGELILTVDADVYDTPVTPGCGACRRCEQACPTGALAGGGLDQAACVSCRTQGGESGALHGWIFGCDVCLEACPYGRHVVPSLSAVVQDEDWLGMSENEFAARFSETPLARAGLKRLQENVRRNLSEGYPR